MFLHAHHLVATNPSNANPTAIFSKWLSHELLHAGNTTYMIGNLIGAGTANGDYNNWLLSRIKALFNPVTSRSNTSRPTFSPIATFTYNGPVDVNPYIYLLGADPDNISNVTSFIQDMSSIVHEQISGSKQLGAHFEHSSGAQMMTHFYHGPALPTWHWFPVKPPIEPIDITAKSCAARMNFLTVPDDPVTPLAKHKYPDKDEVLTKSLYLVTKPTESTSSEYEENYVTFDVDEHVTPDVRYFDPYEYNPSKLSYTILTGLCIESAEIDGFMVPQPNLDQSLATENSYLLNAALPLTCIRLPAQINSNLALCIYNRTINSHSNPAVHVNLYNSDNVILPNFSVEMLETRPATLFGFSTKQQIKRFSRAFNSFGFNIQSREESNPPNIPRYSIYAWSSYRYLNPEVASKTPLLDKVYLILNFRTIYGTNVTMAQSVHPSILIPKA
jgi:hypothetical protein